MLFDFVVYTALAAAAPLAFPGIRVNNLGTAALIAVVFGVLNLLIGWLVAAVVALLAIPFVIVTLGLFGLVIPTLINTVLLLITDNLIEGFEIRGFWPAVGMGLLFAIAGMF